MEESRKESAYRRNRNKKEEKGKRCTERRGEKGREKI